MSQTNLSLKKSVEKPHKLLDHVIKVLGLKNDAALARVLGMTNSAVCRVRTNGPVSDDMLLIIHDEAPDVLTIAKLQELRGERTLKVVPFARKSQNQQHSHP